MTGLPLEKAKAKIREIMHSGSSFLRTVVLSYLSCFLHEQI